ncbi:conserved exported hypothetical protein [uncultured delta proteobacterium]|uniref:Lipoprotein n=1 Tax=uncultured delta proteobacterium TaxID=34034 RepID=A0A212KBU6_9DELT|nr:conserved exported hypothetical protein [uncultured delta proteobacterium]
MEFCQKLRMLPIMLLCAASSGCAFFTAPDPVLPTRVYSPVEQFILSRTPGTSGAVGTVSDPAFGDNLRIVLEQEYLSGAGETCRRASLFSSRGEAEVVVMCRGASGLWTMAPRVWGIGLPPAATPPAETPDSREPEAPSSSIPSPAI